MTRRTGFRLATLAAGLIILAQGMAGAATTTPRITAPVNVTKDDLSPGRLYLAPALAVDPSNPLHVAAAMTELRTKTCFMMRSTDGGQTWNRPQNGPGLTSYPFCNTNNRGSYEAQIAFGRNGNLYMAFPGWDTQDAGTRGNVSLLVARSNDFGNTWQTVVARDNRAKQGLDAEGIRPVGGLAVDSKSGSDDIVYVTYASRLTNASAPNAAPNVPSVVVSTDGGRHFGAPMNLAATAFSSDQARQAALSSVTTTVPAPGATTTSTTAPPADSRAAKPNQVANFGGFEPAVAVADDGTAYAAWPVATANVSPGPPTGVYLSKSTDKGKTWTSTQAVPYSYNNDSFIKMAWSPGGGPDGTVLVTFPYDPKLEVAGLRDIMVTRSTDGGKTFAAPQNITDDDPTQLFGQYYQAIKVTPDGKRIDAVWYDTRNDPGYRSNDVYYAYSTDDGKTWSKNLRISDQPIDRRLGVWSYNYDITTPPGMASANSYAMFAWDDPRNSDVSVKDNTTLGGGLQDVFFVDAQFKTIGGGASKTAKIVAAGVVGLLAVGLILLIAAFVARGRAGGPSPRPAKKAADKTPAKPAKV